MTTSFGRNEHVFLLNSCVKDLYVPHRALECENGSSRGRRVHDFWQTLGFSGVASVHLKWRVGGASPLSLVEFRTQWWAVSLDTDGLISDVTAESCLFSPDRSRLISVPNAPSFSLISFTVDNEIQTFFGFLRWETLLFGLFFYPLKLLTCC